MNTLNILLPYEYISKLVNLTWSDISYGIKEQFLNSEAAIKNAYKMIGKEEEPSHTLLDLASVIREESIHPYIDELVRRKRNLYMWY